MKVIEILRENNVSFSFLDRMQKRDLAQQQQQDIKQQHQELAVDQKYGDQVRGWYNKNIQPKMTNFFKTKVFGFSSIEDLHLYISDTVYESSKDPSVDSDNYETFERLINQLPDQLKQRLHMIRQNTGPLIGIGKEIYQLSQDWFNYFKPDKGKTMYSLVAKYLPVYQRQQVTVWFQTLRWLLYLRKYFPKQ